MKPLFGDIIVLISLNAAFALAITSSSSSWAFCRLSFRMVSDVCVIKLIIINVLLSECKYAALWRRIVQKGESFNKDYL